MNSQNKIRTLTVKVGTSTLTYSNGNENIAMMERLVRTLCDLKNRGIRVVLVSSGAIAVGFNKMGLEKRPETLPEKQAAAAVGQCELVKMYDKLFTEYGATISQILLTKDVVRNELRRQNAVNTFERLLELGIIPIVNENDTISTEEIEFGDNDILSAYVAALTSSDALCILTDTDGLYDKNPMLSSDASLIRQVDEIDDNIKISCGGSGTKLGTGGMITKVLAAEYAVSHGIETFIINGKKVNEELYNIADGKAVYGTCFRAKEI